VKRNIGADCGECTDLEEIHVLLQLAPVFRLQVGGFATHLLASFGGVVHPAIRQSLLPSHTELTQENRWVLMWG
jgi:hypothetical protein